MTFKGTPVNWFKGVPPVGLNLGWIFWVDY